MEQATHPERFEPSGAEGTLIDTEHRARYWWAARLANGRDVLDVACGTGYGMRILSDAGASTVVGVDINEEAVAAATERVGAAGTVLKGDLRDLPLEDDSVDVVVCLETIEHVERAGEALREIRRVLRPGGVAVVSSPNPGVYRAGNDHHVHEFSPEELVTCLREVFADVELHRQHAWLTSLIEREQGGGIDGSPELRATAQIERGDQTYSIAIAGDGPLPALEPLIAMGSAFEVAWFEEQIDAARERALRAEREREEASRLIATQQAAMDDLRSGYESSSERLLEAERELAQVPLISHRLQLATDENAALWGRVARAEDRATRIEQSSAYRLALQLRRLRPRRQA